MFVNSQVHVPLSLLLLRLPSASPQSTGRVETAGLKAGSEEAARIPHAISAKDGPQFQPALFSSLALYLASISINLVTQVLGSLDISAYLLFSFSYSYVAIFLYKT